MYILKLNHKKIFKFLVSGGSAAVIEYVVFLLIHFNFQGDIIIANGLSFMCGLIVSFSLNKYWVFRSKQSTHLELIRYMILATINLLIGTFIITFLTSMTGVYPAISKLIVMVTIAVWNYILFSKIIFKQ